MHEGKPFNSECIASVSIANQRETRIQRIQAQSSENMRDVQWMAGNGYTAPWAVRNYLKASPAPEILSSWHRW